MKKLLSVLALFGFAVLGFSALAQDASAVVTPPPGLDWLGNLVEWLSTIPKVGPILTMVLKYVGAAAAVFTALSLSASAILKVPELVARWSGANSLADKIEVIHAKVKPWLDYLSIFNAKRR